ncbi:hypothetical protein JG687_00005252 [Phytophthora cactorum]|uniref:Uncharacterized protein n=1 Tax=Phytophthora cactorum TaxID=29920 RepID=A0A8T1GHP9_9STRA|nr:hypothetical protein GQ600_16996 [Phytophthora cactorum]KAG2776636.1 hypothetical protein Pcac1_g12900 [Phytophthora cactorum]KAG2926122.1 hypothetical protein PC114_g3894 [Phytophthora cactorum]KAG2931892.1 hypothetical protein PC115_g5960 [Phytophthora cactorum]KAG2951319.1 hypothetical protein PC117_g3708 [Phytophthora cactorum]
MEASGDGDKRPKLAMEDDDWQDTENSYRGPSLGPDPTTAPDFMTTDGPTPPQLIRNNNSTMNGTLDSNDHEIEDDDLEGTAEVLSPPQAGGGNDSNVAKTGRLLTFADETGGSLVEMTYSNRTHYSKQAGPGAVQGVSKGGCCVVQ